MMAEVETVSQQYLPLSAACSSMYFTLESRDNAGSLDCNMYRLAKWHVKLQHVHVCIYAHNVPGEEQLIRPNHWPNVWYKVV